MTGVVSWSLRVGVMFSSSWSSTAGARLFHMIWRYLRLYLGLYLGQGVGTEIRGRAATTTRALEEVELVTDLLQQKYELKRSDCAFEAGIHLIKLKKIQRQFVFVVPRGYVKSPSGVPVFMWFHGLYQTPWFSIYALGLPDMLERYGWFGILPFGTEVFKNSSMGGPLQCCSEYCDSEKCCLNAKEITSQEHPCFSRLLDKEFQHFFLEKQVWICNVNQFDSIYNNLIQLT